jgi:hypothetical protein
MDALEIFAENLQRSRDDWSRIQEIFTDHLDSCFLKNFITREIAALGNDAGHVVPKSVGQANFTFINTPDFEYSVRILTPFPARPHPVKWLGMRQIIGVKGSGSATIRKLTVPPHLDIASFQPGVVIDQVETVTAAAGDVIVSQSPHQLLDIYHVASPVIVEVLTHRREDSGLFWTFDPGLKSVYAEQSSLTVSRFRNVLELAHAAGKPIPDDIYDLALDPSRPHAALLAIRSMLMSGHPDAFSQLQRAIDSESEELSQGAQRLFDSMMSARGASHAT